MAFLYSFENFCFYNSSKAKVLCRISSLILHIKIKSTNYFVFLEFKSSISMLNVCNSSLLEGK